MKNSIKTLSIVLTFVLVVLAFTGCAIDQVKCSLNLHTLVDVEAKAPTCTEDGYTAHKACECGYTEGKEVVLASHTLVDVEGKEATCTEDGYTAHKACECGYTEGKEVVSASHTLVDVEGKEATCTEDGYTAHKACECGYTEGKEVVLASHTLVDVEGKEATCTEDGYTAHKACECGYSEGKEVVPASNHVDENGDYLCDNNCSTVVEPAADSVLTIEQALVLGSLTTTTNKYYISGVVVNIDNSFNGNMYITDGTNTIYIYGTCSADGSIKYDKLEVKPYAGDTVVMYGTVGTYEGKIEMKNAWMTELSHTHSYADATCEKLATCVCGDTQGSLAEHDYKDGLCSVCNAPDPNYSGDVSVSVGKADFDSITTNSSQYKTYTTDAGWVGTYCAVLSGGEKDANPVFMFLGDSTVRAFTINGRLDQVGSITSPVLSDGISKLTFNYGHAYTEANGVDITISIIQNGEVVTSYHLDVDTISQKTAYEFVWVLDVEVYGEFTIEIVNNSPTQKTGSNKDRVSIWNLEWVSNPMPTEEPEVKPEPQTVVMANTITDTQTSYFTGENDAELVGLDPTIFSVISSKGSYSAQTVLYYKSTLTVPSQIRLYNHSSANGNSITVSVAEGYEIVSIKITFAITGRANGYVITDADGNVVGEVATDATIDELEAVFDVNSGSFTLKNVHTGSSKQIWIDNIEIVYQEK